MVTIAAEPSQEERVRRFYTSVAEGGEGATHAYLELMGDIWLHGDPAAEATGLSQAEAARVLLQRYMNDANVQRGDLVIDFGSGPGGATLTMAAATGARFVGISNSETPNQVARARAAERGMADRVSFVTVGDQDYRTLTPWPDNCIDAATAIESPCHLSDRQALFTALFRVLKPGGRLVVMDWIQRPFGSYRTEEEIAGIIRPVCDYIRLAFPLGTVDGYATQLIAAGFTVLNAQDLWEGKECWGSTPPQDRDKWLSYDTGHADEADLFARGKQALDTARGTGVFSVAYWLAEKPAE